MDAWEKELEGPAVANSIIIIIIIIIKSKKLTICSTAYSFRLSLLFQFFPFCTFLGLALVWNFTRVLDNFHFVFYFLTLSVLIVVLFLNKTKTLINSSSIKSYLITNLPCLPYHCTLPYRRVLLDRRLLLHRVPPHHRFPLQ